MWEGLGVWGELGGNTELALAQLLVVEPLSGCSGFWVSLSGVGSEFRHYYCLRGV